MVTPFKVGDRVKLLFKVPSGHAGWDDDWIDEMDCGVGEVLVVDHVVAKKAVPEYCCEFPDGGRWNVPGFALELVKSKPVKAVPKTAPKVSKPKPKVDKPLLEAKDSYREDIELLIVAARRHLEDVAKESDRMGFIRKKADFAILVVENLEPGPSTCPFCQDKESYVHDCKKCEYGKLKGKCDKGDGNAYNQVCDKTQELIEALEEYRPD